MKLVAGVGPTAPFSCSLATLKGNSLLFFGTVAVLASNLMDAVDAKKSSGSGSGSKSKPKTSTKLKGLDSGSENTESSPFPTGIVVGAAIGGFALGVIVTALGFCCYSRKKSQSQPDQGVQMITVTPNHNTQGLNQYPGYFNQV